MRHRRAAWLFATVATIGLLIDIGPQFLVVITERGPTAMSCDRFFSETRPPAWVRLTGCQFGSDDIVVDTFSIRSPRSFVRLRPSTEATDDPRPLFWERSQAPAAPTSGTRSGIAGLVDSSPLYTLPAEFRDQHARILYSTKPNGPEVLLLTTVIVAYIVALANTLRGRAWRRPRLRTPRSPVMPDRATLRVVNPLLETVNARRHPIAQARRQARSWWTLIQASVTLIVSVCLLVAVVFVFVARGFRAGLWSLLVAAIIVERLSRRVFRKIQLTAAEAQQHDRRPPVLLLRSFVDDRVTFSSMDQTTMSELVSEYFNGIGPVIAIQDPRTVAPTLGPYATRVDSSHWPQHVKDLIGRAAIVLVFVGRTPGIGAELAMLAEQAALNRTCLLFAPVTPNESLDRWEFLNGFVQERVPALAPLETIDGYRKLRAAYFSSQGQLTVLCTQHGNRTAYERTLQLLVHEWARRPRSTAQV
jgi:hypothetical protein